MTQLVLVEDNRGYAAALRNCLEAEGYEVGLAGTVTDGLTAVQQLGADLVLLDLSLPGAGGLEMLRTLRGAGNDVPVLILTASRDEVHKDRSFGLGADDYVTKPVAMRGLLARIRALLRRVYEGERAGPSWVRIGDIAIHPPTRVVQRRGVPVDLRPKEYDLLLALLRQRGRPVSRADLLRDVWRQEPGGRMRTVDTHVVLLRRKLEQDPRAPRYILTVHGGGYMLARAGGAA